MIIRIVIFSLFVSVMISACEKATTTGHSGEIFTAYVGKYTAVGGSATRFRFGVDTVTTVDTFTMNIDKITGADSAFNESRLAITNLLGLGANVQANATYIRLFPEIPANVRALKIDLVSDGVLSYSYYIPHGVGDTSRVSGTAKR